MPVKKALTKTETLRMLSLEFGGEYLEDFSYNSMYSLIGDVVIDSKSFTGVRHKLKKNQKTYPGRMPRSLHVFGSLYIDNSKENSANIVTFPNSINATGKVEIVLGDLPQLETDGVNIHSNHEVVLDFKGASLCSLRKIKKISSNKVVKIKNLNEKIIMSPAGGATFNPTINSPKIVLESCPNLHSIPSSILETDVEVVDCPNLNMLPERIEINTKREAKKYKNKTNISATSLVQIDGNAMGKVKGTISAGIIHLKNVDISEVELIRVESIKDLRSMLMIDNCILKNNKLPKIIVNSKSLERVVLCNMPISEVPKSLALTSLKFISVYNTNVSKIPDGIYDLEGADLCMSKIKNLPPIFKFDSLHHSNKALLLDGFERSFRSAYLHPLSYTSSSPYRMMFDFGCLDNMYSYVYRDEHNKHHVSLIDFDGVPYIFATHDTVSKNMFFTLEEYKQEISSVAYHQCTNIPFYPLEQKAFLKNVLAEVIGKWEERKAKA